MHVGPIPADRNVTGSHAQGEQMNRIHGLFHPCTVCNLEWVWRWVCQKGMDGVSGLFVCDSACEALGEYIVVTEKVAEHRKASRRSVEASDLRRTVAGTETLPTRHIPWLESCPSCVTLILMFEHVRRWMRRPRSPLFRRSK